MDTEVCPVEVLEALWTALRDNYPAFEFVVGAEEQPWLDEFRGRLEGVTVLSDAYPILAELVARFHDYHTGLWWPEKPDIASPAVRLGYIDDFVAVRNS